jgi:hypothetical protein
MVDYSIDNTFDLFKTEYNDIAEVDGIEEFEQDLIVQLNYRLQDYIGGYKNSDTLEEKITLIATRLAREYDFLDSINRINATELPERRETIAVEIVYESSRNFTETL